MRFTSLLIPGVVALLQTETAVSPMSQVVKLLEDTLKDLLDERTNTEAAYKKMDCLTKKTVEANNKLIEENSASRESFAFGKFKLDGEDERSRLKDIIRDDMMGFRIHYQSIMFLLHLANPYSSCPSQASIK